MSIPTFVVIPYKDKHELTIPLVDELVRQYAYEHIFLMDNDSSGAAKHQIDRAMYERWRGVDVMECRGMNLHQMWNFGLDYAKVFADSRPHNVLILNNDISIGSHFIEKLSRAIRESDQTAISCPNYDRRPGEGIQYVEDLPMHVGHYDGTEGMCGFAFMVRGEDGYRFPSNLAWWCGDNDLRLTAKQQGRRIALALDAECTHIDGGNGSGGFREEPMRSIVQRDIRLFHEKWKNLAE